MTPAPPLPAAPSSARRAARKRAADRSRPAADVVTPEIAVHVFDQLGEDPPPELLDLWPRLRQVLGHQAAFNQSEAAIRSQQHGMIRDLRFLVPSPFADTADGCDSSYYFPNRFFYQFIGAEEFFWITALLDRAYALTTIYFPARRTAVSLYPASI